VFHSNRFRDAYPRRSVSVRPRLAPSCAQAAEIIREAQTTNDVIGVLYD
jgi:hypothetical protein